MQPLQTGFTSVFNLACRHRNTDFALRFNGRLRLAKTGKYAFSVRSSTGSQLWIDGKALLEEKGTQALNGQTVSVRLSAGDHAIKLGYYKSAGPTQLDVEYSGPGLAKQPLGPAVLPER
jgi:hypothetical protein